MLRLIGAVGYIWLVMAISSVAQRCNDTNSPVLDTSGQALQRGVEYYILPSSNSSGGGLTLINRNGSCPLYVGQEDQASSQGYTVTFAPFFEQETIIRESRDFSVQFVASTICIQSTAWRLGERDPETQRRLIVTGGETGYFRIERNGEGYYLAWCPTDVCPICKFDCGSAGILVQNGKRLLALDGPVLSVVFMRA
ncbi:alpha-amylase/subtilisin inhibitor-like [Vitis riparia]|uniref:alpha-amylase/subtilisin inhibitor-like n=1 Tax=Vitis riparia TaxID=96939 RepID=UPI00155B2DBF|nr:alpha-amylase/subtilisin inhibitor-like [Vitis riparia]